MMLMSISRLPILFFVFPCCISAQAEVPPSGSAPSLVDQVNTYADPNLRSWKDVETSADYWERRYERAHLRAALEARDTKWRRKDAKEDGKDGKENSDSNDNDELHTYTFHSATLPDPAIYRQQWVGAKPSGGGSYGDYGLWKALVVNQFVKDYNVSTVLEFGSGDGSQLRIANYHSLPHQNPRVSDFGGV